MKLTPRDSDRLTVFLIAELARRRRERGLLLGHPEAVAYLCDEMHEAARDGRSYDEVTEVGRTSLTSADVMDGVAAMIPILHLEVMFADGTKLVVVRDPIRGGAPEPSRVQHGSTPIARHRLDLPRVQVPVHNTSRWPVVITSHFHFFEANRLLDLPRAQAFGMHLDIPAGASERFDPDERRSVRLVGYAGERAVFGFNGLTNAVLGTGEELERQREHSLDLARREGFLGA